MTKPERHVVFLIGLPGSGKSLFLKEAGKIYPGYEVIERDQIVRELGDVPPDSSRLDQALILYRDEAERIYDERVESAIKAGKNIILERPHDNPALRSKSLKTAKSCKDYAYKTTALIISPPNQELHLDILVRRFMNEGTRSVNYANRNKMLLPVAGDGEFDEVKLFGEPSKNPLFHEYDETPDAIQSLLRDQNTTRTR